MGGIRSGRHGNSKATTSQYPQLDLRRWQREGLLVPGSSFWRLFGWGDEVTACVNVCVEPRRVILSYGHRGYQGAWQHKQYTVWLDRTPCNYGGTRAWFLCPGCRRRVAILYGGNIFACRRCYELAYQNQRESDLDRGLHRAQTIRMKLGGSGNSTLPFPPKPKGLHWRTYLDLQIEAAKHEQVFLAGMSTWLARMGIPP